MQKKLYNEIADKITQSIFSGIYATNDKMPSLRNICKRYNISITTAKHAYSILENKSLIVTKPRSGFYVRENIKKINSKPLKAAPIGFPENSKNIEFINILLNTVNNKNTINLGITATPSRYFSDYTTIKNLSLKFIKENQVCYSNYENSIGETKLKVLIAQRMIDSGCYINPYDIIITSGCQNALSLALSVTTNPGDTVAVESPTYFGIIQLLDALKLNVIEIPTNEQSGVDLNYLSKALSQHTIKACVFMPTCHNPLGVTMSDDNKKRLVTILNNAGVPLIEDDVMGDLSFVRPRPRAAKTFDTTGNVIYCSSVSKILGPGHRLGWIIPGKYLMKVNYLKTTTSISTAMLSQQVIASYLEGSSYTRLVRRAVNEYKIRIKKLQELVIHSFPTGTSHSNPAGGFLLWVKMPNNITALAMHNQAKKYNIGIGLGNLFSSKNTYSNYIRLSCSIDNENLIHQNIKLLGKLAYSLIKH